MAMNVPLHRLPYLLIPAFPNFTSPSTSAFLSSTCLDGHAHSIGGILISLGVCQSLGERHWVISLWLIGIAVAAAGGERPVVWHQTVVCLWWVTLTTMLLQLCAKGYTEEVGGRKWKPEFERYEAVRNSWKCPGAVLDLVLHTSFSELLNPNT